MLHKMQIITSSVKFLIWTLLEVLLNMLRGQKPSWLLKISDLDLENFFLIYGLMANFRGVIGEREKPQNFFTPMTPSKSDSRPPKKKISYIFLYHLYKKFLILGFSDRKWRHFFATPKRVKICKNQLY